MDFKSQIAANQTIIKELHRMIEQYGLNTVHNYMKFVQDNAEECVRKAIKILIYGDFSFTLDKGSKIKLKVIIDKKIVVLQLILLALLFRKMIILMA